MPVSPFRTRRSRFSYTQISHWISACVPQKVLWSYLGCDKSTPSLVLGSRFILQYHWAVGCNCWQMHRYSMPNYEHCRICGVSHAFYRPPNRPNHACANEKGVGLVETVYASTPLPHRRNGSDSSPRPLGKIRDQQWHSLLHQVRTQLNYLPPTPLCVILSTAVMMKEPLSGSTQRSPPSSQTLVSSSLAEQ